MTSRDQLQQWQDSFKLGRGAGQADVALEILKHDPSSSHEIARRYLARLPGHEGLANAEVMPEKDG